MPTPNDPQRVLPVDQSQVTPGQPVPPVDDRVDAPPSASEEQEEFQLAPPGLLVDGTWLPGYGPKAGDTASPATGHRPGSEDSQESKGIVGDILTGISESPGQILGGARDALQEIANWTHSAGTVMDRLIPLGRITWRDGGIHWDSGTPDENPLQLPEISAPDSETGQIIRSISQFATGFIGAGKVLKGIGWAGQSSSRLLNWGRAGTAGAAADAVAFDPYQNRIANLIQEVPQLQNPITEYLEAKPEDSEAEGRFKNALEGLGLGAAGDMVFGLLRGYRRARVTGNHDELDKVAEQASDALHMADQKAVQKATAAEAAPKGTPSKSARISEAQAKEIGARLRKAAETGDYKDALQGIDFNFRYRTETDGGKALIDDISEILKKEKAQGWVPYRSHAETEKLAGDFADTLGMDPEYLAGSIRTLFGDTADLDVRITAARMVHQELSNRMADLGKMIDSGKSSKEAVDELRHGLSFLAEYQSMLKSSSSSTARALASHRIPVGDGARLPDESVEKLLKGKGKGKGQKGAKDAPTSTGDISDDELKIIARQLRAAKDNPAAVAKIAQAHAARPGGTALRWHNEYYVNALLSGAKTHALNVSSTLLKSYIQPLEDVIGGALTRNPALMRQGGDEMVAFTLQLLDNFRVAARALTIGGGELDTTALGRSIQAWKRTSNVIDPTNTKIDMPIGEIPTAIGTVIRTPSRLMLAEDEFLKQMAYRARIRAMALREGRAMGKQGKALSEHVHNMLEASFDSSGKALNPAALLRARQASWTQDLGEGTLGNSIQNFRNAHPATTIVLPFIRTPTNLLRDVWQHTPVIGAFQHQMRADLRAGGERAAAALGKQALGVAFYATAASLAYSGHVTGGGPTNGNVRKLMYDAGWQPYSFRIPTGTDPTTGETLYRYISYRRGDPYGAFFGLVADAVEASGEVQHDDYAKWAGVITASVARNLTSKTYLIGLTNVIDAFSSGDPDKLAKLLQFQASSYVPNFLGQINPDDTYREARGFMDAMLAKVPGYSDTLPPSRNIFGEPILKPAAFGPDFLSPFVQSRSTSETVYRELANLGKSLSYPPKNLDHGQIDLTSTEWEGTGDAAGKAPYDRWMELMGIPDATGMTLKKQLTHLIESGLWQRLPDTGEDTDNPRLTAARRVVNAYINMNKQRMLQEYPELRQALEDNKRERLHKVLEQVGN